MFARCDRKAVDSTFTGTRPNRGEEITVKGQVKDKDGTDWDDRGRRHNATESVMCHYACPSSAHVLQAWATRFTGRRVGAQVSQRRVGDSDASIKLCSVSVALSNGEIPSTLGERPCQCGARLQ